MDTTGKKITTTIILRKIYGVWTIDTRKHHLNIKRAMIREPLRTLGNKNDGDDDGDGDDDDDDEDD